MANGTDDFKPPALGTEAEIAVLRTWYFALSKENSVADKRMRAVEDHVTNLRLWRAYMAGAIAVLSAIAIYLLNKVTI